MVDPRTTSAVMGTLHIDARQPLVHLQIDVRRACAAVLGSKDLEIDLASMKAAVMHPFCRHHKLIRIYSHASPRDIVDYLGLE